MGLSDLGWLDFSRYPAAAISIGLLMFAIGFTTIGRAYVIFPHVAIYDIIGLIGAGLVAHGLITLYRKGQRKDRREERLTNSIEDYLESADSESGLPDIATEGQELRRASYDESLKEVENDY